MAVFCSRHWYYNDPRLSWEGRFSDKSVFQAYLMLFYTPVKTFAW